MALIVRSEEMMEFLEFIQSSEMLLHDAIKEAIMEHDDERYEKLDKYSKEEEHITNLIGIIIKRNLGES